MVILPFTELEFARRYPKTTLAIVFATIGLVIILAMVSAAHAQTRSYFDRNGTYAGRSSTYGNTTTYFDRSGRYRGRSTTGR